MEGIYNALRLTVESISIPMGAHGGRWGARPYSNVITGPTYVPKRGNIIIVDHVTHVKIMEMIKIIKNF